MKTSALASLSLLSVMVMSPALAHNNECDIELSGHIQYQPGFLTVEMEDGGTLTIDAAHTLTINHEPISLNSEQLKWVGQYYDNIDMAIPMTLSIASEGLDLANVAVTEVFGELLGEDNGLTQDFGELFTSLEEKLAHSFYDENGIIYIDSTKFDEPGWFDESWEAEFESQIESLVSESMGRLLIAIGTQMLWDGGDMSEFEAKMERFGESLEHRMEAQADALEEKADALCDVLEEADYAETKMQKSIPGLSELNLLDMDSHSMKM